MVIINKIRGKITRCEYEFTVPHFFEEMANDNLTFSDIEMAIAHGRVRRKFTRDPRGDTLRGCRDCNRWKRNWDYLQD